MTDRGDRSPGPPWAPDPWPGLPWPEPWDPTRPDAPAAPGRAGATPWRSDDPGGRPDDAAGPSGATTGPAGQTAGHAAAPGAWSTAVPPATAGTPRPAGAPPQAGGGRFGTEGTPAGAEGAPPAGTGPAGAAPAAAAAAAGQSAPRAAPGEATEPWDPARPDPPECPPAGGYEAAAGLTRRAGRRRHQRAALVGFAAVAGAAAAGGALVGPARPATMRWYRSLAKPPFQPPASVFGPVWSVLYGAIALSGWRVWRRPAAPDRTRALRLWAAQMAANAAWTPLFFGARRPGIALADLAAQLSSTAGYAATAARVDRPAAALMVPYLAWTAFAGVLNEEIVRRNR
ncbi:MAG TPA: tryptophan-rich sensory protein [Acidimicrobiales bacterium]